MIVGGPEVLASTSKPVAVTMTSTSCTVPSSVSMPLRREARDPVGDQLDVVAGQRLVPAVVDTGRRENGA